MSFHVDLLDSTSINISGEGLEEVPLADIIKHPQILIVNLSINCIRTLSLDFAPNLSHIVQLDLSNNLLEKLPPNFGQLDNLEHLDLYTNKIMSLPVSMAKMTKLTWLDMKDNPINNCLKEVVGEFWNDEECRKASKRLVFFMTQVRIFIKNVKDREFQNVHSFTLQTNPFAVLTGNNWGSNCNLAGQSQDINSFQDNNNPGIQTMSSVEDSDEKTWNFKKFFTIAEKGVLLIALSILFSSLLLGPGRVEQLFTRIGYVDNVFTKIHSFVHAGLLKFSYVIPIVKDDITQEQNAPFYQKWYQAILNIF